MAMADRDVDAGKVTGDRVLSLAWMDRIHRIKTAFKLPVPNEFRTATNIQAGQLRTA